MTEAYARRGLALAPLAYAHSRVELGLLRLWSQRERAWGSATRDELMR